jgi:hypothetical protein
MGVVGVILLPFLIGAGVLLGLVSCLALIVFALPALGIVREIPRPCLIMFIFAVVFFVSIFYYLYIKK